MSAPKRKPKAKPVEWPYWLVRSSEEEWVTWDGKRAAQSKVEDLQQSANDANEPKPWTEIVKMVPHDPRAARELRLLRAVAKAATWLAEYPGDLGFLYALERAVEAVAAWRRGGGR